MYLVLIMVRIWFVAYSRTWVAIGGQDSEVTDPIEAMSL